MSIFTMMVGVAGSGKSTIAMQIAQKTGATTITGIVAPFVALIFGRVDYA